MPDGDSTVYPNMPPEWFDLQPRHKSACIYYQAALRASPPMDGVVVIGDLNFSLLYGKNSLGFDVFPCISTKSVMMKLWPESESELISDRHLFDAMGLDANCYPLMHLSPHTVRQTIAGEAFVMPQVGSIFLSAVAHYKIPISPTELDVDPGDVNAAE